MNKKWWEDPTIVFVNFWYVFLLLLILAFSAYFTRTYWLPSQVVAVPIPTIITETQIAVVTSVTEFPRTLITPVTTEFPTQIIIQNATEQLLEEKPEVGYLAPTLLARTSAGEQKIISSDYKGHPILLFVFSSWCPYCREEAPIIEKLYQKYKDSGLVVLPINNTSNDNEHDVNSFVQNSNWSFFPLFDENGASLRLYDLTGIPGNFFIDKEGIIQDIVVGAMTESDIEISIKKIIE